MARRRTNTRTSSSRRRRKKSKYKIVNVGRFDSELRPFALDDGDTVGQVLDKAGITLAPGEEVNNLNGETLSLNDKVKAGDSLIIVGNYKSGWFF